MVKWSEDQQQVGGAGSGQVVRGSATGRWGQWVARVILSGWEVPQMCYILCVCVITGQWAAVVKWSVLDCQSEEPRFEPQCRPNNGSGLVLAGVLKHGQLCSHLCLPEGHFMCWSLLTLEV